MDHHEFSPSRLEQYRLCPGSYHMQKGLPEVEGEWAAEGQLLHKAIETGVYDELTDDQIATVEDCKAFALSLIQSPKDTVVEKEKRITVTDTDGSILTFGIADVIILEDSALTIIDWKFGYTPVNNVNENIQLAAYALAAMQEYRVNSCDCWVYQPRIHRKSHHVFTNGEAIRSNIRSIIKRAKSESLSLKPSDSACRYCRARLNCPAFRLKYQRISACKRDYDLSDTSTLVSLYEASKGLKTFINEIESAVKSMIERDGRCGKYVFQTAEGSREVKDLNALYALYRDLITPQEFNSVCKLTLTKFESMVSSKLVAEAKARGETLTLKDAKAECYNRMRHLVTRGNPTKKIVESA